MRKYIKKILIILAYRIRSWPLIILTRYLKSYWIGKQLVTIFDPNFLRKNYYFTANSNLKKLKWSGLELYVNVNEHIGYQSFINRQPFEMAVYNIAEKMNLTEKDVILDIGANIGLASIPLCAKRGCELWAVEASKDNALLLVINVLLCNIKAKIHLYAITSGEKSDEYIKLYQTRGNSGANSVYKNWNENDDDAKYELSPTISIDQLMFNERALEKIKLIKIDVEGSELDVIRGGSSFFKMTRAPIILEYRPDINISTRNKLLILIENLSSEYNIYALDEFSNYLEFRKEGSYENIILIKKHSVDCPL